MHFLASLSSLTTSREFKIAEVHLCPQDSINLLDIGAGQSLDSGDHVYAAFNLSFSRLHEFHKGIPLPKLRANIANAVRTLQRMKENQQRGLALALDHIAR